MALLANAIGEPAERQQVAGAIERDAVVEIEALARQHLFGDGLQVRIGDVQFGHQFNYSWTPRVARSNLHETKHW